MTLHAVSDFRFHRRHQMLVPPIQRELTSLSIIQFLVFIILSMLGLKFLTKRLTWREKRQSQPHWWWRSQRGDPWCLQWDSAGPPSWSSCLSRCRQRWPCQSKSPPVAGLMEKAPLLVTMEMLQTREFYQTLTKLLAQMELHRTMSCLNCLNCLHFTCLRCFYCLNFWDCFHCFDCLHTAYTVAVALQLEWDG